MKAMQVQLNYNTDNSISQEHFGCIKKLRTRWLKTKLDGQQQDL